MRNNLKARLKDYLHAKGIQATESGYIKCPWHDDKNPSCKINEEYLYCFSCNESGDIYKLAAALIGVPCDREHFREIANEVEKTLGIPEWVPPKPDRNLPKGFKYSMSIIFRYELLKDFASAIDSGDLERAYNRACLLLALFMLPEKKEGQK